jgi:hypothetical protein
MTASKRRPARSTPTIPSGTSAIEPDPTRDPDPGSGDDPSAAEPEPLRAFDLLTKVKSGETRGKDLRPEDRQTLVSILSAEGASTPDIANLLKVSDRTIERDRQTIAKRNALTKDPALTGIMLGRLRSEVELSLAIARRLARDKDVDPAVRLDAASRCVQMYDLFISRLQTTGHVDRVAQHIQADVTHQAAVPTAEAIAQELERLKAIDPAHPNLQVMEGLVARAAMATTFKELICTPDGTEVLHEDRS